MVQKKKRTRSLQTKRKSQTYAAILSGTGLAAAIGAAIYKGRKAKQPVPVIVSSENAADKDFAENEASVRTVAIQRNAIPDTLQNTAQNIDIQNTVKIQSLFKNIADITKLIAKFLREHEILLDTKKILNSNISNIAEIYREINLLKLSCKDKSISDKLYKETIGFLPKISENYTNYNNKVNDLAEKMQKINNIYSEIKIISKDEDIKQNLDIQEAAKLQKELNKISDILSEYQKEPLSIHITRTASRDSDAKFESLLYRILRSNTMPPDESFRIYTSIQEAIIHALPQNDPRSLLQKMLRNYNYTEKDIIEYEIGSSTFLGYQNVQTSSMFNAIINIIQNFLQPTRHTGEHPEYDAFAEQYLRPLGKVSLSEANETLKYIDLLLDNAANSQSKKTLLEPIKDNELNLFYKIVLTPDILNSLQQDFQSYVRKINNPTDSKQLAKLIKKISNNIDSIKERYHSC